MAGRIEICTPCDWVWYRRSKKKPQRCPHCHSRAWDRPYIKALLDADKATQPDQPTQPPNVDASTPPHRHKEAKP